MLSIQNNTAFQRKLFKRKEKQENFDNKTPNTHAGLKTGAVYGALGSVATIVNTNWRTSTLKLLKELQIDDMIDQNLINEYASKSKLYNRNKFIMIPICLLSSLGCGAIVDSAINKNRAKLDKKLAEEDKKEILANNNRVDTTRNGALYYKSNQGKKLGTILGAVLLPASGILSCVLNKNKISNVIANTIQGALGGLILGTITDACANKSARHHADKQHLINGDI